MKHFSSRSGISLIAVLMFMLAATTASVVLFRWIGSENFASGSRLKQSEAYQASEAGLDAVYSWLSFRAADAGGAISKFIEANKDASAGDRVPLRLNEFLTDKPDPLGNSHSFDVFLVGLEDRKDGKPFKLKILSVGNGRDNSKVSQTAVFSVGGLYNMEVPLGLPTPPPPSDYDEDFWGNMGTVNNLEVAKAIITQSPDIKNAGGQALNTVTIGTESKPGYLVLDGNFYANNGMKIYGDVYSTGNLDFCPNPTITEFITGNLYVEGKFSPKGALRIDGDAFFRGLNVTDAFNPNTDINSGAGGTGGCSGAANGGVVFVGNNSTIGNNFVYWNNGAGGGLGFHVAGNLVMDNGEIVLTRAEADKNETDSLAVAGNAYVKNNLTGNTYNNSIPRSVPFFGYNESSIICAMPEDMYRTNSTNIKNPSTCSTLKNSWGADPMDGTGPIDPAIDAPKNYKNKLEEGGGEKSCDNTPIQFNKEVYDGVLNTANPPSWVHRKDKPGSCDVGNDKSIWGIYVADALGTELQKCWEQAKNNPSELYDGEWLVIYINHHNGYTSTPGQLTSGKYILIVDFEPFEPLPKPLNLSLPPTSVDAQVMLYFPKGYPGKMELAGTQLGTGYRYFIFSDGNINQFDTGTKKLHGNVFMNNCAVMNLPGAEGNANFRSEGNSAFVQELMTKGILCKNPFDGSKIGCQDNPNNSSNPNPSSSSEAPSPTRTENFLIPVSTRLKVELESKNISREKFKNIDNALTRNADDELVLVMPRVVYIAKNTLNNEKTLKEYYSFLPINGGVPPPPTTEPSCSPTEGAGTFSTSGNNAEGVYVCRFGGKVSDFTVVVNGDAKDREVNLDKSYYDATECINVLVTTASSNGMSECKVTVNLINAENGWTIDPAAYTTEAIIPAGATQAQAYRVCPDPNVASPSQIRVELEAPEGCNLGNVKTATIEKPSGKITVLREEMERPDIDTVVTCPASGPWTIASVPPNSCSNPSTDHWECAKDATITLNPPAPAEGENSCQLFSSTAISNIDLSKTNSSEERVLEASYKLNRHNLRIISEAGYTVTLNPVNEYEGKNPPRTCANSVCNFTLYYGDYTVEIIGPARRVSYNGATLSAPYKIKLAVNSELVIQKLPGNCNYEPSMCGGRYPTASDVPILPPQNTGEIKGGDCFFVKVISQFCSNANGSKINGDDVGKGPCGSNSNLPEKKDDGYYILIGGNASNGVTEWSVADNTHPTCGAIPSVNAAAPSPSMNAAPPSSSVGSFPSLGLPMRGSQTNKGAGNWSQKTAPEGCSNDECNLRMFNSSGVSTVEVNDGATKQTLTVNNGPEQTVKLKIPFDIQISGGALDQIGCQ